MFRARFLVTLSVCLVPPSLGLAFDAFSDRRSPPRFVLRGADDLQLTIKGWLAASLRDLEGEGGPGHDSITDTATLGTRSPHAAIDGARVALRLDTSSGLRVNTVYGFSDRGAAVEHAWLQLRWTLAHGLTLHTELGLSPPFVSRDPRSARAPLAARIYWRAPEIHWTGEFRGEGSGLRYWAGLSVAMMRPLATDAVNDAASRRGTIAVLAYGRQRPFSGNHPVYGGKAGAAWGALDLEIFGFWGRLAPEGGVDELRNRIARFSALPGFDPADPRAQDPRAWWYGGRAGLGAWGARLDLEGVGSRESLITRRVLSLQLGYVFRLAGGVPVETLELRVRHEDYGIDQGALLRVADPSQALTWDVTARSLLFAAQLRADLIWLRLEHTWLDEDVGEPGPGKGAPLANDETTLGFEVRY